MKNFNLENSGLTEMSHEDMTQTQGGFWGIVALVIAGFLTGIGMWVSGNQNQV